VDLAEAADSRPAQLIDAIQKATSDDSLEWARTPQLLIGGFTTEMWSVQIRGSDQLRGHLVARLMPDGNTAAREVIIQRFVADAGFPTPRILLSGPPTERLSARWMLMEFVEGRPLLPSLDGVRAVAAAPRLMRSLPDTLATCAAALHQLTVGDLREELGVDDDVVELVGRMRARMVTAGRHDLTTIADELVASRPERHREVLCHGDLHPLNVLVGAHGTSLIDWSTGLIADPIHEIAFTRWLLSNPPLDASPAIRRAVLALGRMMSRRFATVYARAGSIDTDPGTVAWFERLHALRVLSELAITDIADHPFRHLRLDAQRRLDSSPLEHPGSSRTTTGHLPARAATRRAPTDEGIPNGETYGTNR
jgi:aminoglycoside phosphotransferase (APT) family kinase protein